MNRHNLLIKELCDEIDHYQEQILVWKQKYEALQKEYIKAAKETIDNNNKMLTYFLNPKKEKKEKIINPYD